MKLTTRGKHALLMVWFVAWLAVFVLVGVRA